MGCGRFYRANCQALLWQIDAPRRAVSLEALGTDPMGSVPKVMFCVDNSGFRLQREER
jgi:hypothetical protein